MDNRRPSRRPGRTDTVRTGAGRRCGAGSTSTDRGRGGPPCVWLVDRAQEVPAARPGGEQELHAIVSVAGRGRATAGRTARRWPRCWSSTAPARWTGRRRSSGRRRTRPSRRCACCRTVRRSPWSGAPTTRTPPIRRPGRCGRPRPRRGPRRSGRCTGWSPRAAPAWAVGSTWRGGCWPARTAPIPHVLMLTDGRNEHDERMPLAAVLDACEGAVRLSTRGASATAGTRRLLLDVAGRLHGAADAVHEEERTARRVPHVGRRPARQDRAGAGDPRVAVARHPGALPQAGAAHRTAAVPAGSRPNAVGPADFTTRAWGNELRRYQLCLVGNAAGRPRGEDLQAAAVEVVLPEPPPRCEGPARRPRPARRRPARRVRLPAPRPYLVHWTDDPAPLDDSRTAWSTTSRVRAARAGRGRASHAFRRGPRRTRRPGCWAPRWRWPTGWAPHARLAELERLVEICDPAAGQVALRPGVRDVDFEYLITVSTHTHDGPEPGGPGAGRGAPRPGRAGRLPELRRPRPGGRALLPPLPDTVSRRHEHHRARPVGTGCGCCSRWRVGDHRGAVRRVPRGAHRRGAAGVVDVVRGAGAGHRQGRAAPGPGGARARTRRATGPAPATSTPRCRWPTRALALAAADDVTGPSGRLAAADRGTSLISGYGGWVELAAAGARRVAAARRVHGATPRPCWALRARPRPTPSVMGRINQLQHEQLAVVDRQAAFGWALWLALEPGGRCWRWRWPPRWPRRTASCGRASGAAGTAGWAGPPRCWRPVRRCWRPSPGAPTAACSTPAPLLHRSLAGGAISGAKSGVARQMAGTGLRAAATDWILAGRGRC